MSEETDDQAGVAVVLAGGRSTRFGRGHRAFADVGGTPTTRRVADRIAPVTDSLVVSCRREQRARIQATLSECEQPVTVVADRVPDRGPLAGVARGLDVAVSRVDGRVQPTHAVYRTGSMETACECALASGQRRASVPLEELSIRNVPAPTAEDATTPATFHNVDSRNDYDRARHRLEEGTM